MPPRRRAGRLRRRRRHRGPRRRATGRPCAPRSHRAGVVYGTVHRRAPGGSDIVVVRDDNWRQRRLDGARRPRRRPGGTPASSPASRCRRSGTLLGSVRVSSRIAIAVDPRNRRRVYLAWCDGMPAVAPRLPPAPAALRRRRDDLDRRPAHDQQRDEPRPRGQRPRHGWAALPAADDAGRRQPVGRPISRSPTTVSRPCVPTCSSPTCRTSAAPSSRRSATTRTSSPSARTSTARSAASTSRSPPTSQTASPTCATPTSPNQRLLGNDGVTVRASSIDPFYVFFSDVAPADDFFVRDWTDSPTSFDTGVEPSIRPAFWARARRLEPARHVARHVHQRPAAERAGRQRRRQRRRQLGVRAHPPPRGQPGRCGGDRHRTLPRLASSGPAATSSTPAQPTPTSRSRIPTRRSRSLRPTRDRSPRRRSTGT